MRYKKKKVASLKCEPLWFVSRLDSDPKESFEELVRAINRPSKGDTETKMPPPLCNALLPYKTEFVVLPKGVIFLYAMSTTCMLEKKIGSRVRSSSKVCNDGTLEKEPFLHINMQQKLSVCGP